MPSFLYFSAIISPVTTKRTGVSSACRLGGRKKPEIGFRWHVIVDESELPAQECKAARSAFFGGTRIPLRASVTSGRTNRSGAHATRDPLCARVKRTVRGFSCEVIMFDQPIDPSLRRGEAMHAVHARGNWLQSKRAVATDTA